MEYKVLTKTDIVDYPKVISLDTEYSEKDVTKATLLSISIGVSATLTYILEDFYHAQHFVDAAEIIYTWNGVVDWFILDSNGFRIPKEKILDAMLMEHLVDENHVSNSLGAFALRNFNDNYKEEFWGMYDSYQEAPKEVQHIYESKDGCYTYIGGEMYRAALKERMDLTHHAHKLQWALFNTEIRGVKVNRDLIVQTREDMAAKIAGYITILRNEYNEHCKVWELEKWYEEIGKRKTDKGKAGVKRPVFSFSSDSQLGWLVYSALECPVIEKTKKGSPKTDYDTLKRLSEDNPTLKTIVDYKETKAVFATFVEGMLERVEDDRIYPSFFVNGTKTGRISHGNPNMGNLPTEGVIRNFFIPDYGMVFMGADYSQLEVVVEANLTNDANLLKIINEGISKHDITAQGLGITRDQAKTLNFALQYGAGVFKVSKILDISKNDAQDIFDRYWQLYSGVKALKDQTTTTLRESGEVTNLFGRTRRFGNPSNEFDKAKQERQAYNFLIQGVGADITNMATYLIADRFKQEALGHLMFSVHDEILTQVYDGHADRASRVITQCMEEPNEVLNFKYPVTCKLYGPLSRWSKT